MSEEWIGRRVSFYRNLLGMTQQELADRVGVSRTLIAMIERGERSVDKRSRLLALAEALKVSPDDLTGQPRPPRNRDDMHVHSLAAAVRQALDEDPEDGGPARPVDALARAADEMLRARMFADYPALSAHLPGVIRETRLVADTASDRVTGLRAFVQATVTAAFAVKPFGYVDLATRLGERALWAAELAGDEVCAAAARFTIAQSALAGGCRGRSYRLAAAAADELGGHGGHDALAWWGLLHLHAALSAGSLGRGDDAEAHLAEAADTAPRVAGDPWRMEFTPANVELWRLGVALENGHPERAPALAARVNPADLRTPARKARLHMDAARGCFLTGDHAAAVRRLLAALETAPFEVRRRATVEEMVGQMLRDARRGPGEELRTLSVRLGIDPLSPPDGD